MNIFSSTKNTRPILENSLRYVRSDVPTAVTEEEREWLLSNDLTTIVDLRTPDEAKRKPSPLSCDSRFDYRQLTVTGGDTIPSTPDEVGKSYISMVDNALMQTIDYISRAKSNVLFFCNAGKDRTGVVSAMLLLKAGKSREYIVNDYLKSRDNLKDMLEKFASENPDVDIKVITPSERYITELLDWLEESVEF